MDVRFLPPYSPFYNPIECVFKMWKDHVRNARPKDEEGLQAAINGFTLTAEQANAFVRHTNQNCRDTTKGIDPLGMK